MLNKIKEKLVKPIKEKMREIEKKKTQTGAEEDTQNP
jgi:hypothetical protein